MDTSATTNDLRPYLSVVATARNDDHGGNLLGRMQIFVDALIEQAKRHELSMELILVEWNPPAERPSLAEALRWPADRGPCAVRVIEVPERVHRRYRHAEALPLYQMIAKNVGIRRSRGQYVLATNIDIIFSDELCQFLAERRLQPGRMYRVDRHDVMSDVPPDRPVDEQLAYCKSHLLRINARVGSFGVTPAGLGVLAEEDIADPDSGVFFGPGWFPVERDGKQRYRWVENDAELVVRPAGRSARRLSFDLEPGPGVGFQPFLLEVLDGAGKAVAQLRIPRRMFMHLHLAPGEEEQRFWLRVAGGGLKVAHDPRDPRILNFRVFRCAWEEAGSGSEARTAAAPSAEAETPGLITRAGRFLSQVRSFLGRYRQAAGPLRIGVPLPAGLLRRLQPHIEGGGVTVTVEPGRLRAGVRRWWRTLWEPAAAPDAIVEEGTELVWAAGWYAPENSAGESFRWGRQDAKWIIRCPAGPATTLRLLIEPGPAIGFQPFHLQVRDRFGKTVATAVVNGRQWAELPLPWAPGRTDVFTLHCEGGGTPRPVAGETRDLWFRVARCGWSRPAAAGQRDDLDSFPDIGLPEAHQTLPLDANLTLGFGWSRLERMQDGTPFRWANDGAEIIVHQAEAGAGLLHIEVGAGLAQDAPPVELAVETQEGQPLLRRPLRERQTLVVPLPESPATAQVLRFRRDAGEDPRRAPALLFRLFQGGIDGLPQDSIASGHERDLVAGALHLHTNGCGDFTLLARDHWFELRGYPEFDLFSMNLDSVFCYAAHHGGAREQILRDPVRIYHIEHATGSGFTPEGQEKLFQRIATKGIPWLDYQEVVGWAVQMQRLQAPMIFNREDWGLAAIEFPERAPRAEAGSGAASEAVSTGDA